MRVIFCSQMFARPTICDWSTTIDYFLFDLRLYNGYRVPLLGFRCIGEVVIRPDLVWLQSNTAQSRFPYAYRKKNNMISSKKKLFSCLLRPIFDSGSRTALLTLTWQQTSFAATVFAVAFLSLPLLPQQRLAPPPIRGARASNDPDRTPAKGHREVSCLLASVN